jgi:hypothetical protein
MLPAAEQLVIMHSAPKTTASVLTVTMPLSQLHTVLLLLPLLLKALLSTVVETASTTFVPQPTAAVLTATMPPSQLHTVLLLLPLLLRALPVVLDLAIDSVPVLTLSVPKTPVPPLTVGTLLLLALTLLDLADLALLLVLVAILPLTAVALAETSPPTTHSAPMLSASTPIVEMLTLLTHTTFLLPPMTGIVPSLTPTALLLSAIHVSSKKPFKVPLASLDTAIAISPDPTVVVLKSATPLSNKKLRPLPLLLVLDTSATATLQTATQASTAEAKLVMASPIAAELKVTVTTPDMDTTVNGEQVGTVALE